MARRFDGLAQGVVRERMLFIPRRCEAAGCAVTAPISKCGRCALVFYCGREHQAADWARHKVECRALARLKLVGFGFDPAEELARFPLGALRAPDGDARLSCAVCGARGGAGGSGLTETRCCDNAVCDNEHKYQLNSFQRDLCPRSHERYTACGAHATESHEGDWRTCARCEKEFGGPPGSVRAASLVWRRFNGFNCTPGLPLPKGTMLTGPCEKCGGRIAPGFEGTIIARGMTMCMACEGR